MPLPYKPKPKILDDLAGSLVRARGNCEVMLAWQAIRCVPGVQWGHIISRRYEHTRWNLNNAFAICDAHHKYFTAHPKQWDICVERIIGAENYEKLKKLSLMDGDTDYGKVLYYLNKAKQNGQIENGLIL